MKKNRIAIILLAAVGLLILAAGHHYWQKRSLSDRVIPEIFGSKDVFDAFVSGSNVTAQRLHWRPEKLTNSPGGLSGYEHEKPLPVAPALAQKVQLLLQRASSYDWAPYAKGCIVDYGVLLTFHSGKRTVRVALCFNCNWLGIFDGEDEKSNAVNREDDFDPIRRQLVSVVKAIFPDDAEIQDLK